MEKMMNPLDFKVGINNDVHFEVLDSNGFISSLCPNEQHLFKLWIGKFDNAGGLDSGSVEVMDLYDLFMGGNSVCAAVRLICKGKTPLKYSKWLSFVNGEYKDKHQDELVEMYIKYLAKFN